MKNLILNVITGLAMGSVPMGFALIGAVGLFKTISTIMIIFGICWLVPFVIINKKAIYKSL